MYNLSECIASNKSIQKLAEKKKQNFRIAELYEELGKHSKAEKLKVCNSHPIYYIKENKLSLLSSLFCRERMCPTCAYVRSNKIRSNVLNIILDEEFKDCGFNLITLTVRNCKAEELNQTIDNIYEALRRLTSNKNSFFNNYFNGMFVALEITYNEKEDTYHPHVHTINSYKKGTYAYRKNMKGKRIEIEQLSKKWGEALNVDYNPSVSIRNVYNSKYKQVAEVAKYTVKGSDIKNAEVLKTIENAIYGRRLISYKGLFKSVKRKLKLNDEIDINKKPSVKEILNNPNIVKVVYSFNVGFKSYIVESIETGKSIKEEALVNEIIEMKGDKTK